MRKQLFGATRKPPPIGLFIQLTIRCAERLPKVTARRVPELRGRFANSAFASLDLATRNVNEEQPSFCL